VTLFVLASILYFPSRLSNAQQKNRQLDRSANDLRSRSERRTALIIGNGAYSKVPALKNPANDAVLVAATLKNLGFEVSIGTNKSQREMKQLIRDFGQRLRSTGGVGLFYYAGHGVQANGHNYLIPIDADIENEADLEDVGVDVNYVLNQISVAQSTLNIVILDACRNNPFVRSFRSAQDGLAQVMAPRGTLIAYATAPNSTAADGDSANSPYTEELTKQIEVPGVVLETTFRRVTERVSARTGTRQEPWVSDNHKGEFYFKGGAGSSTAVNNDSSKIDPVAVEREYWEAIRNSANEEDYKNYLQTYPNGAYSAIARTKINQIQATDSSEIRNNRKLRVTLASISQYSVIGEDPPSVALHINGDGWDGGSEVKVFVNEQLVTGPVNSQNEGQISFRGKVERLHVRDGRNELFIEVNGVRSNTYVFTQAVRTTAPITDRKHGTNINDAAPSNETWQTFQGPGFVILLPKKAITENRRSLYHGGYVNRTVHRTPIWERPFFAVITANGINARASRPGDAEELDSYVDAFKYWLPEAVFGKGQAARVTLIGEKALGGNPAREYQVSIGDSSGVARAYFNGTRFFVAVALDSTADQARQYFDSFKLR
jgi:uncharacterized caspase-like protein